MACTPRRALVLVVSRCAVATVTMAQPATWRQSHDATLGGWAEMAYEGARGRLVWFGNGAQTWEWDSCCWTRRSPETTPPEVSDAALEYDAVRQRVVLFGGRVAGVPTDAT